MADFVYKAGMLKESDYRALYPIVKGSVIRYECHGNKSLFDEDMFNETAYHCLLIMRGKWIGVPVEYICRYFCKAYKINKLREKLYMRNQKEIFDDKIVFQNDCPVKSMMDSNLDCLAIKDEILRQGFPLDIEILFRRNIVDGCSIAQLEKETGIKGLKYQFHKIKEGLRKSKVIKELCEYFDYGDEKDK